jgi:hypothetical protein
MREREPRASAEARLVLDYHHETRGLWRDGAVFRIRIFSRGELPPVVIASELPENTNVSVTNFAEVLAAEVISRHLPQRFEHDDPVVWLEHYPPGPKQRREKFEFDRVTFASWTPRVTSVGGLRRVSLGAPTWHPLRRAQLAALLGEQTARSISGEHLQ